MGRITCSAKTPPVGLLHLPAAGRSRNADGVAGAWRSHSSKLQRAVVHAGRQAETIFGQRRLAAEVTAIHAADLRDCHMALINKDQRVVGDVFEQGGRRFAGLAAGQIARIVLDAGAGAGGLQHFQIKLGALLQPLGLEQAAGIVQFLPAAASAPP